MTAELSRDDVLLSRIAGQRLADRASGDDAVHGVVHALAGIQAQVSSAAPLAVRARTASTTSSDVAEALGDRRVVRTWWVRGTIHLVARGDLAALPGLLAPQIVAGQGRRARELGLDDRAIARGAAVVEETVHAHGRVGRDELARALRRHRIDPAGQRIAYLVHRAGVLGKICLGPERSGKPTYEPLRIEPAAEPGALLGGLVRRYLAAYGPARVQDFVTWSGLGAAEVNAAWRGLAGELEPRTCDGQELWLRTEDAPRLRARKRAAPTVALLPGFDPYVLGYRGRELMLDGAHGKRVNAGGGMVRATVAVDGRLAGTWTMVRKAGALEVEVSAFEPLGARLRKALEGEAADVGRFLGEAASLRMAR